MYNIVLVSAVWQSDSVLLSFTLFRILFPCKLLQNIDYSSLCYAVVYTLILNSQYLFIFINYIYISFSSSPPLNLPLPSPLSLLFLPSSYFVSSLSSISASLSFLEFASVVSVGTLYQMHLALTPN